MKSILTFLSHRHPVQILLSTLLSVVLFFAGGCSSAPNSASTQGTVQPDKIEQKAAAPAMSFKPTQEIQDNTDRNNDAELPVVTEIGKALNKLKG